MVMTQIGLGIVAFAKVISTASPAFMAAIVAVLSAMIDAIVTLAPKIMTALATLLQKMLSTLAAALPSLINSGVQIIMAILTGIKNNIAKIAELAVTIIANFINGVAAGLPRIIESGVNLILSFINGLTNAINAHSAELGTAGGKLAVAIVQGMVNGIRAGVGQIASAARDAASSALDAAKSFLGINSPSKEFELVGKYSTQGFANGLTVYSKISDTAAENMGASAMNALKMSLSSMNSIISGDTTITPAIRPVLDLTDVKQNAGLIEKLLAAKPLYVSTSTEQATAASSGYQNTQDLITQSSANSQNGSYVFNQYNTSPVALSEIEIYRQTNNQLSAAKGVVATA